MGLKEAVRVRKYARDYFAVIIPNACGVEQIVASYQTRGAAEAHAKMARGEQ